MKSNLFRLYQKLLKQHGEPEFLWPQWCAKTKDESLRELIAIGAILTQRTSWRNAHLALVNLRNHNLLTLGGLCQTSAEELIPLVRPAGFFQTKPKRLINFAKFVTENYGSIENLLAEDTLELREELLDLYGIGPESADTILLYALDKPSFIADEYARRFLEKNNLLARKMKYQEIKQLFESSLPQDTTIYQRYHILIIRDQKGDQWSTMEVV